MQIRNNIILITGFLLGGLLTIALLFKAELWLVIAASIGFILLAIYQSKHIRIVFLQSEEEQKIAALLKKSAKINTYSRTRLKIGNTLDKLGDTRKGVGLDKSNTPDIDWVKIPAGEFLYGDDKQKRQLKTFYISRYPITNRQFQAFIDDNGYNSNAPWWKGLTQPELRKPHWSQANRPKENINWYEAIAFCRWLSQKKGYVIALPEEQQWEKAARGTNGKIYPWGDTYKNGYANTNEILGTWLNYLHPHKKYLKQTTAVGIYPQGASEYGVMDLSGNVWEWCINKYDDPKDRTIDDSGSARVLRGGSWLYLPNYARSAYRNGFNPGYRLNYVGFRVVCSLPSEN